MNTFLSSRLLGVNAQSVDNGQCNLARGWYLVRATAHSVDHQISVLIKEKQGNSIIYEDIASTLLNCRLRAYFYTTGGQLISSGFKQVEITQFPPWQIRLRTFLRLIKQGGRAAGKQALMALMGSGATLLSLQKQMQGQRDIFAGLDKLAQKGKSRCRVHLVPFEDAYTSLQAINQNDDYVIFTDDDIALHPAANKVLDREIKYAGLQQIFYSQHFNRKGLCYLKPDFDPVYFQQFDYIGPAVFWRVDVAKCVITSSEKFTQQHLMQALYTVVQGGINPIRIDEYLVQSTRQPGRLDMVKTEAPYYGLHLQTIKGNPQVRKWTYSHTDKEPSVSIIIPTYNGLELLKGCIESLKNKTGYDNQEIIVVNNNSDDGATLAYFEELKKAGYRVLDYPHPFNYSAINNFAVSHATGEYICLLNNDVEAIEAGWLHKMVAWAGQRKVGAVGARLLYANDSIQHAGVAIGVGNAAGHTHRFETGDREHLWHRVNSVQVVTAVTAACLVVSRKLFNEVNGLDEKSLAVAYNDIDFCLKLDKAGYQNIYCADACLYHLESVSRGDDMAPDKVKRYMKELRVFQKRWKTKRRLDRIMSKHQDRHSEQFPQIFTERQF